MLHLPGCLLVVTSGEGSLPAHVLFNVSISFGCIFFKFRCWIDPSSFLALFLGELSQSWREPVSLVFTRVRCQVSVLSSSG